MLRSRVVPIQRVNALIVGAAAAPDHLRACAPAVRHRTDSPCRNRLHLRRWRGTVRASPNSSWWRRYAAIRIPRTTCTDRRAHHRQTRKQPLPEQRRSRHAWRTSIGLCNNRSPRLFRCPHHGFIASAMHLSTNAIRRSMSRSFCCSTCIQHTTRAWVSASGSGAGCGGAARCAADCGPRLAGGALARVAGGAGGGPAATAAGIAAPPSDDGRPGNRLVAQPPSARQSISVAIRIGDPGIRYQVVRYQVVRNQVIRDQAICLSPDSCYLITDA